MHYSARTASVLQCLKTLAPLPDATVCYTAFLETKVMEITQEHILIGIVALAALGALILLVWGDPDERQDRNGG